MKNIGKYIGAGLIFLSGLALGIDESYGQSIRTAKKVAKNVLKNPHFVGGPIIDKKGKELFIYEQNYTNGDTTYKVTIFNREPAKTIGYEDKMEVRIENAKGNESSGSYVDKKIDGYAEKRPIYKNIVALLGKTPNYDSVLENILEIQKN